MKSRILAILLLVSSVGFAQVPNTETFTLDTVRKVLSLPANSDLSTCFSTAVKGNFDPLYDSIGYAPVKSLKRFRNYTPVVGGCVEYGYLYNFHAVIDARNIAPSGWHIPTQTEWNTLKSAISGTEHEKAEKLRTTYSIFSDGSNGNNTNETGFSLRAAGYRIGVSGVFAWIGYIDWIASSTYAFDSNGRHFYYFTEVSINKVDVGYFNVDTQGSSVRLLMDGSNPDNPGTMTGNDGKVYQTVKIGNQVWMAENLAETKYRNGDVIPTVTDNSAWAALTTGAKCAYNNDQSNVGCGE